MSDFAFFGGHLTETGGETGGDTGVCLSTGRNSFGFSLSFSLLLALHRCFHGLVRRPVRPFDDPRGLRTGLLLNDGVDLVTFGAPLDTSDSKNCSKVPDLYARSIPRKFCSQNGARRALAGVGILARRRCSETYRLALLFEQVGHLPS